MGPGLADDGVSHEDILYSARRLRLADLGDGDADHTKLMGYERTFVVFVCTLVTPAVAARAISS